MNKTASTIDIRFEPLLPKKIFSFKLNNKINVIESNKNIKNSRLIDPKIIKIRSKKIPSDNVIPLAPSEKFTRLKKINTKYSKIY